MGGINEEPLQRRRRLKLETLQWLSTLALWSGFCLAVVSAFIATLGNWASQKAGDALQAKNETLQRAADGRIASLNVESEKARLAIADAQERTALANEAAEKARAEAEQSRNEAAKIALQLAHTRQVIAGRYVTDEQAAQFAKELKGHHFNIGICFQDNDLEEVSFAVHIMTALTNAGQEVQMLGGICTARVGMGGGVTVVSMTARGVPLDKQDGDPVYRALIKASMWGGWWLFPSNVPAEITHVLLVPQRSAPSLQALEQPPVMPQPKLKK